MRPNFCWYRLLVSFVGMMATIPTNGVAAMLLTDAQCRAAKPSEKVQKLSDGRGLFLQVTPGGSKLWRMTYRWQEKQRTAPASTRDVGGQALPGQRVAFVTGQNQRRFRWMIGTMPLVTISATGQIAAPIDRAELVQQVGMVDGQQVTRGNLVACAPCRTASRSAAQFCRSTSASPKRKDRLTRLRGFTAWPERNPPDTRAALRSRRRSPRAWTAG